MSWIFFYYVRYNYNHFFYFYLDLMCDVLGTGPVYYYTGPVTLHTGTVTTILDPVLSVIYRYQLMFLYGSTCSLVENTKEILQLENFPHSMEGLAHL